MKAQPKTPFLKPFLFTDPLPSRFSPQNSQSQHRQTFRYQALPPVSSQPPIPFLSFCSLLHPRPTTEQPPPAHASVLQASPLGSFLTPSGNSTQLRSSWPDLRCAGCSPLVPPERLGYPTGLEANSQADLQHSETVSP